jgi:ankyrin repeat protein
MPKKKPFRQVLDYCSWHPSSGLETSVGLDGVPHNISEPDGTCRSKLLQTICWADDTDANELNSKIALLLRRGAKVTARDIHGRTCLHILFKRTSKVWKIEALVLLLNAGADVHAIDYYGDSVSDIAKKMGVVDIWEDALMKCGYDPAEVQRRSRASQAASAAIEMNTSNSPQNLNWRRSYAQVEELLEGEDNTSLEALAD